MKKNGKAQAPTTGQQGSQLQITSASHFPPLSAPAMIQQKMAKKKRQVPNPALELEKLLESASVVSFLQKETTEMDGPSLKIRTSEEIKNGIEESENIKMEKLVDEVFASSNSPNSSTPIKIEEKEEEYVEMDHDTLFGDALGIETPNKRSYASVANFGLLNDTHTEKMDLMTVWEHRLVLKRGNEKMTNDGRSENEEGNEWERHIILRKKKNTKKNKKATTKRAENDEEILEKSSDWQPFCKEVQDEICPEYDQEFEIKPCPELEVQTESDPEQELGLRLMEVTTYKNENLLKDEEMNLN